MQRKVSHLAVLVLLVAGLVLAGCSPAPQQASQHATKLKAAFILQGTHDDGTWNAMAWQGKQKLEEMGYETAYSEGVSDADVARVMRNYASEGYNLIWAHSGTYPNSSLTS